MKKIFIIFSLCFWVFILSTSTVVSAWSGDPSVNTPVVTADENQSSQKIVYDGQGGWFIVWHDNRMGSDIYAQYFDADGEAQWAENGIAVCDDSSGQSYPKVILNGSGGIIVSWADGRNDSGDIYAQNLDAEGNNIWTANGVPVIATEEDNYCGWLVSDGDGGAIVMSHNYDDGEWTGGSVNRINSAGTLPWGTAATPVTYSSESSSAPKLLSDGSGGAILVWIDSDTVHQEIGNIAVQRVDNNGNLLWNCGVPILITDADYCMCPRIISDGSDGAIIMWMDERIEYEWMELYIQKINGSGVAQWTANGVLVTSDDTDSYESGLASDEEGGAFVTWSDTADSNVYARRIGSDGSLLWSGPVQLTTTGDFKGTSDPPRKTVEDGSGGFITGWINDSEEVMVQRVDKDGTILWADNGVVLSNASGEKDGSRIAGNGEGGAVAVWWDRRNDPEDKDIYMQGVTEDGELFGASDDDSDSNCFISSAIH